MFDFDLAILFDTETRKLKQNVKRNMERFPNSFMIVLTEKEMNLLVSQNVIPSKSHLGGASPFAFTEHGVTMLASILKSDRAIKMSIAIVTAFIEMKKQLSQYSELAKKIHEPEQQNNAQFLEIYEALETLINATDALKEKDLKRTKWKQRAEIGFTKAK